MYSISEVVELTGMSQHTLRLYEREGFFVNKVQRDSRGNRAYDESDVDWLQRLGILRAAGMPIAEISRYVQLVRADSPDENQIEILANHRERVLQELRDAQERLGLMDDKIALYRARLDEGGRGAPWPEAKPDGEAGDG